MDKETLTGEILKSAKDKTFSQSLKDLVNSPITGATSERLTEVQELFNVPLETIRDAMNATLIVNALKGSEKSYELIVKMVNEAPKEEPAKIVNQSMFVIPNKEEMAEISSMLSDEKKRVAYEDIAGAK